MQLVIYLFLRPLDNALYRRCMGWIQSQWVGVASSSFPETNIAVTCVSVLALLAGGNRS
jgi:hypothetical protein